MCFKKISVNLSVKAVEEYSNLTMITLSGKMIIKKGLPIDG